MVSQLVGVLAVAAGAMLLAACNGSGADASDAAVEADWSSEGASPDAADGECDVADHCVSIDGVGVISQPDLVIHAGESVAFSFADRWQSVVDIERLEATACDDETLERPYSPGQGVTGPMPRFAGGITVRGEPDGDFRFPDSVWQSDDISGVLLTIPWQDVEPAPGEYDFSVFVDALRDAARYGKLVSIGVQMGARCPPWIYELSEPDRVPGTSMVTMASSGERCFDQVHPSFWHENYRQQMTNLQTALSEALRAHAGLYRHIDKIKISGVNLMTSETRMPVSRELFCGFEDRTCSNGGAPPTPCVDGVCPIDGCGCFVDPTDEREVCGRRSDDLPQLWADAGFRPSLLMDYFRDVLDEQHRLFPEKDINLMQIARAFPNVGEEGVVRGFANPDHVVALIEQEVERLPDHFVVLNASLNRTAPPQEICMEAYDLGVKQIGFQTVNLLHTWEDLEPALANARDSRTPEGAQAISFVEIYLASFIRAADSGDLDALGEYDALFRERSGLPGERGEQHIVEELPPGTYH